MAHVLKASEAVVGRWYNTPKNIRVRIVGPTPNSKIGEVRVWSDASKREIDIAPGYQLVAPEDEKPPNAAELVAGKTREILVPALPTLADDDLLALTELDSRAFVTFEVNAEITRRAAAVKAASAPPITITGQTEVVAEDLELVPPRYVAPQRADGGGRATMGIIDDAGLSAADVIAEEGPPTPTPDAKPKKARTRKDAPPLPAPLPAMRVIAETPGRVVESSFLDTDTYVALGMDARRAGAVRACPDALLHVEASWLEGWDRADREANTAAPIGDNATEPSEEVVSTITSPSDRNADRPAGGDPTNGSPDAPETGERVTRHGPSFDEQHQHGAAGVALDAPHEDQPPTPTMAVRSRVWVRLRQVLAAVRGEAQELPDRVRYLLLDARERVPELARWVDPLLDTRPTPGATWLSSLDPTLIEQAIAEVAPDTDTVLGWLGKAREAIVFGPDRVTGDPTTVLGWVVAARPALEPVLGPMLASGELSDAQVDYAIALVEAARHLPVPPVGTVAAMTAAVLTVFPDAVVTVVEENGRDGKVLLRVVVDAEDVPIGERVRGTARAVYAVLPAGVRVVITFATDRGDVYRAWTPWETADHVRVAALPTTPATTPGIEPDVSSSSPSNPQPEVPVTEPTPVPDHLLRWFEEASIDDEDLQPAEPHLELVTRLVGTVRQNTAALVGCYDRAVITTALRYEEATSNRPTVVGKLRERLSRIESGSARPRHDNGGTAPGGAGGDGSHGSGSGGPAGGGARPVMVKRPPMDEEEAKVQAQIEADLAFVGAARPFLIELHRAQARLAAHGIEVRLHDPVPG